MQENQRQGRWVRIHTTAMKRKVTTGWKVAPTLQAVWLVDVDIVKGRGADGLGR